MGVFNDNITTSLYEGLFKISYEASSVAVDKCKRWYVWLDESLLENEIRSKIELVDWCRAGAQEYTLPVIHVKKLPYWRLRWLIGKSVFHVIIKAKMSPYESMVRVFDKDM